MDKKSTVDESMDGARFDKALLIVMPDAGLRLRRRLIESGQALLNGVKRKPAFKVRAGQEISVCSEENVDVKNILPLLSVVEKQADYAAVFKPSGIHSAIIKGSPDPSVELVAGELLGDSNATLVNRLDYLTSGLLIAAFSEEAAQCFRQYEDSGVVEKFYLARIAGKFNDKMVIKTELDTDSRSVTRVLEEGYDPLRYSYITPLKNYDDGTSLVQVRIAKGARHQIRAHLASSGHPIIGDPVYGEGPGEIMYLHHYKIEFPSFSAEVLPQWDIDLDVF